jgi:hypothetical protein
LSTQFSDWNGFSDTTSDTIEVDEANQADEASRAGEASQLDDGIFDTWWSNLQHEQWVQDQGVQERRYPLRQRKRTAKAAATKLGMY